MKNLTKQIAAILLLGASLGSGFACKVCTSSSEESAPQLSIFAYTDTELEKEGGLQIAYSYDEKTWNTLGNETYAVTRCNRNDKKKLIFSSPYLFKDKEGTWRCIWSLGDKFSMFAHSHSKDMILWRYQHNTNLPEGVKFDRPIVRTNIDNYTLFFKSGSDFYMSETSDFKNYSAFVKIDANKYKDEYKELVINGKKQTGVFAKIDQKDFEKLLPLAERSAKNDRIAAQSQKDLLAKLKGEKLKGKFVANFSKTKAISKNLIGVFFEDINYAADGGLYAELIQNRDFEYSETDNKDWTAMTSWETTGGIKSSIETSNPIHKNNPHHIVLNVESKGALTNTGWDGIVLKKNAKYNFSVFAKTNSKNALKIRLLDGNKIAAESEIKLTNKDWQKFEIEMTSAIDTKTARLEIVPETNVSLDMISLFPQDTYKGRKNGLRKDLVQIIADLKPKFVRFPGGCIVHGYDLDTFYRWQTTIGKLEERKYMHNLWGYHQTMGLGYQEYFQLCEDIGAEPVPVVAAGTSCQFRRVLQLVKLEDMPAYIQEVLDLIEWANGDAKTTKWGKVRAENGHPKPFNLKYIAVGNEDQITDEYCKRYAMIQDAIQKKYPEITVIGNVGARWAGYDYVEGHLFSKAIKTPIVDEHYYVNASWFVTHQDFYDSYDRNGPKIYIGEYAGRNKERTSSIETALGAAMHLANIERNGDVVVMTSYAPLFAKKGYCQWHPDLIYFDNTEIYPTIDYYVQKIFGNNTGDTYIKSEVSLNKTIEGVNERVSASLVKDSQSGDIIVKIINLLPVEIAMNFEIGEIKNERTAIKTVLTGDFECTQAKPVESTSKLSGKFTETLPPNSFVTIRFKK